jgi:hypothetical protein
VIEQIIRRGVRFSMKRVPSPSTVENDPSFPQLIEVSVRPSRESTEIPTETTGGGVV